MPPVSSPAARVTAARPAILGIPFDGASSWRPGPARGPAAIRAALVTPSSNTWTEDGHDVAGAGFLHDRGDVPLPKGATGADAAGPISRSVTQLLDDGWDPLILGGDHSVTYPVLRSVAERFPRLSVLHFDAHADLYDEFEGDRHSHACPFARIMEEGLAARLVQVGIRTLTRHQRDQAARFGVDIREMRHWSGPERIAIDGPVYISLDLDVLDPAFLRGINHPEPGGLSVRDVLAMIQALEAPIVGADVVELCPPEDPSGQSALVAAKFVKELAAAMHRTRTPAVS